MSVRRRGASQWAQLTARQPGGSGRFAAAWRTKLRIGCRIDVAVYPERDDGWHGAGDKAKLLHELSGHVAQKRHRLLISLWSFEAHSHMAAMWLGNRLSSSALDCSQRWRTVTPPHNFDRIPSR